MGDHVAIGGGISPLFLERERLHNEAREAGNNAVGCLVTSLGMYAVSIYGIATRDVALTSIFGTTGTLFGAALLSERNRAADLYKQADQVGLDN